MTTPKLKLVSHKLCPYVQRARVMLAEKGIPHELEFIDLSNKRAWFLAISPMGKVPVLLVDGKPMFESAVITEFLDEITPGSLHPCDPFQKARNRSWIEFGSSTLIAIAAFYGAKDETAFEKSVIALKERFKILDDVLTEKPYFNGQKFSIVDATFGPVFRYFTVFERFGEFRFFEGLSNVETWRHLLLERRSVRDAVVPDYAERLHQFLLVRDSVLAGVVARKKVA